MNYDLCMGALHLISRFPNTTTVMRAPSVMVTAALLMSEGTHAIFRLRGAEGADSGATTETFDLSFSDVNALAPPAASHNIRRGDQTPTPDPASSSPVELGNGPSGAHVDDANESLVVSSDPVSTAAAAVVPVASVPSVSAPPSRREVPAVSPATISIDNATSVAATISPAIVPKAQELDKSQANCTYSQRIEKASPGASVDPRKVGKLVAHPTTDQSLDGRSVGANRAREPYQPNAWFGPEESSGSAYGYRSQPFYPQNFQFFGEVRRQVGWPNYMSFNSRPLKVSRAQRIEL